MKDKVQKIREEVARLKSNLMYGACSSQVAMEAICKEEAYNEVLAILDSLQEEPVSEDLKKAAEEYAYTNWASDDYHEGAAEGLPFDAIGHTEKCFKAGAKWQKAKDQSTIELAEDHAMLAGMEKTKEEMMAKTINGKVIANGMGNPILHLWDKGRDLIGKKVKVIVIEED